MPEEAFPKLKGTLIKPKSELKGTLIDKKIAAEGKGEMKEVIEADITVGRVLINRGSGMEYTVEEILINERDKTKRVRLKPVSGSIVIRVMSDLIEGMNRRPDPVYTLK